MYLPLQISIPAFDLLINYNLACVFKQDQTFVCFGKYTVFILVLGFT